MTEMNETTKTDEITPSDDLTNYSFEELLEIFRKRAEDNSETSTDDNGESTTVENDLPNNIFFDWIMGMVSVSFKTCTLF